MPETFGMAGRPDRPRPYSVRDYIVGFALVFLSVPFFLALWLGAMQLLASASDTPGLADLAPNWVAALIAAGAFLILDLMARTLTRTRAVRSLPQLFTLFPDKRAARPDAPGDSTPGVMEAGALPLLAFVPVVVVAYEAAYEADGVGVGVVLAAVVITVAPFVAAYYGSIAGALGGTAVAVLWAYLLLKHEFLVGSLAGVALSLPVWYAAIRAFGRAARRGQREHSQVPGH